jgi:hypothetical protein
MPNRLFCVPGPGRRMRVDGPLDHIEQARWRHRPGNRGGRKPQTPQIASRQAGPGHKAPLNHIADLEHAANKPCLGTPTGVAPILRRSPILHSIGTAGNYGDGGVQSGHQIPGCMAASPRRQLEDDPARPRHLLTEPGRPKGESAKSSWPPCPTGPASKRTPSGLPLSDWPGGSVVGTRPVCNCP